MIPDDIPIESGFCIQEDAPRYLVRMQNSHHSSQFINLWHFSGRAGRGGGL